MKLQIAFDFTRLDQSQALARQTWQHADWLEVGTSLIKSEGIIAVQKFKDEFAERQIVADMKILDAGEREARLACENGADIVVVEACASENTIRDVVRVVHDFGKQVMYDLFGPQDMLGAAKRGEELGVDVCCFHKSTDASGIEGSVDQLQEIVNAVNLPVAVAGRINEENISRVADAGPEVLIVGSAVTKADDPGAAAKKLAQLLRARTSLKAP